MANPYTFQPYKKYKAQFWNGSVSWCQPAAPAEYFKNSRSEVSSDGSALCKVNFGNGTHSRPKWVRFRMVIRFRNNNNKLTNFTTVNHNCGHLLRHRGRRNRGRLLGSDHRAPRPGRQRPYWQFSVSEYHLFNEIRKTPSLSFPLFCPLHL